MSDQIDFVKLSGSGNDFLCIDNRDGRFDDAIATGRGGRIAQVLCRRGTGIGADGVIFAERTDLLPDVDVFARFFEPDGSNAELCGNGTACVIYWAFDSGWTDDDEIKILTDAGLVRGHLADDGYVRVCIPQPEDKRVDLEVTADGRAFHCDYLVTGVPHLITYVEDIDEIEVSHWGRLLRRHQQFAPRGVNVNFVQVLGVGKIAVRTFEFGVEAETLACGTGSAAAAILTAERFEWGAEFLSGDKEVRVRARSGDILKVWFTVGDDGIVTDVCLETIVRHVCGGAVAPALAAEALASEGP